MAKFRCAKIQIRILWVALAIVLLIALSGCATRSEDGGYEFGNLSKGYCSMTTPEIRGIFGYALMKQGIIMPMDYCTTISLLRVVNANTNKKDVDKEENKDNAKKKPSEQ